MGSRNRLYDGPLHGFAHLAKNGVTMAGLEFKPRPKKRIKATPILGFVALFSWLVGFFIFMDRVPKEQLQAVHVTDGIVVLTGGTGRLNAGFELLADKKAIKLLISGVYRGVELQELLALSQQAPEELECCIDIGHQADNTRGNAQEAAEWIEKTGYKSIYLVTANYHMPRSFLEFSYALPDVEIYPYPVFPAHVKIDEWWRWSGTTGLLLSEYNKYLMVWLRHKLARITKLEFLK